MEYQRYAIYYVPQEAALADFGARWLGWDCVTGCRIGERRAAPKIGGLTASDITAAPRRYGFHATIKAPFRLRQGAQLPELETAFDALCEGLRAPVLAGLELVPLGRFLALVPVLAQGDDGAALREMASDVVQGLNRFRAPLAAEEIQRRLPARASARQRDLLETYGYVYVQEAFRFHLTLTGRLERAALAQVRDALDEALAPVLPSPFAVNALGLMGEDAQGYFHLIRLNTLKT